MEDERDISLSEKEEIKEEHNLSLSQQHEIKDEQDKSLSQQHEIKDKQDKSLSQQKEMGDEPKFIFSNNFIVIDESEASSGNPPFNCFSKKVKSYTAIDGRILNQYEYFKINFSEFKYIFITPEPLVPFFKILYSQLIKNSLIFYPKDFKQAEEILNIYEKKIGIKDNWIVISPCDQLEENIEAFHENESIYYFIGYCIRSSHKHNLYFLYKFSKFYKIVDTADELVDKLIKLNNIFYYKKQQNYEIIDDTDDIIELNNYDTVLLIDYNNECSKKNVVEYKLSDNNSFRLNNDESYFSFIHSLTFLIHYLDTKNYDLLHNIFETLIIKLLKGKDEIEKILGAINFLKNLHILYLYFANYPYLYQVLTDEEIDSVLSKFNPDLNENDILKIEIIAINLIMKYADNLATKVKEGKSILNEILDLKILQRFLIEFYCSIEIKYKEYDISQIKEYYQVKNFLRGIDFCLGISLVDIITFYSNNYPFEKRIRNLYNNKDQRIYFCKTYSIHNLKMNDNINEDEQLKIYNKSIKYKDTLVLGDKNFHYLVSKINLPCENIIYLNEEEFSYFFQVPQKIKNKYNKTKYFIIADEKIGFKYIETIIYISNVYAINFAIIIYIQNRNVKINKQILVKPLFPTIITYNEKDILNYYADNNNLKEINIKCRDEIEIFEKMLLLKDYHFPKIEETKIIKEEDNGWDMITNLNEEIFNLTSVWSLYGYIDLCKYNRDMYRVYEENNCLDLFINYYGNYFGGEYLVEQHPTLVSVIKMFLYAYTLQEKDGKSIYSLMNNDLRSGDSEKICRYLPVIRNIYKLLNKKYLKSYNGDIYRAAFFKDKLIDEIKPGKKMLNSSLWSSSKKLCVAKKFLHKFKKNILLHTKVKEGNNIDIHLEKISQFPREEEILLLPFCVFEVKSFEKVKENNLEYYNLELVYCEEENKSNKIENVKVENMDEFL